MTTELNVEIPTMTLNIEVESFDLSVEIPDMTLNMEIGE